MKLGAIKELGILGGRARTRRAISLKYASVLFPPCTNTRARKGDRARGASGRGDLGNGDGERERDGRFCIGKKCLCCTRLIQGVHGNAAASMHANNSAVACAT